MDLGLEGKVAVVTGAGAGIGLAVCRVLASRGDAGRRGLPAGPGGGIDQRGRSPPAGTSPRRGPSRAWSTARWTGHGSLSLLVNNAGGGTIRDGFPVRHHTTTGSALFALNLGMVAVRATGAALPQPVRRRRGAIVNISSINGVAPDTGRSPTTARPRPRSELVREVDRHRVRRPRGQGGVGVARRRPGRPCGWAQPGSRRWWRASEASRPRRSWPGPSEIRSAGWPSRPRSRPSSRSWARRGDWCVQRGRPACRRRPDPHPLTRPCPEATTRRRL